MLFARDPPLFVDGLRAAPITELLELDLPFNNLLVLVRVIVPAFTHRTTQRYQPIGSFYLRHGDDDTIAPGKRQPLERPGPGSEKGGAREHDRKTKPHDKQDICGDHARKKGEECAEKGMRPLLGNAKG